MEKIVSLNKRKKIFDIPVDNLSMEETLSIIKESIDNSKTINQVSLNALIIIQMKKDKYLYDTVINSDIINADGQSVIWASKILKNTIVERVAGIDLMERVVKLAYENSYKIFFFGAEEEIVKKVVDIYSQKYSPNIIAGYRNGYYKEEEEKEIAINIRESKANILFIATPTPKKEIFMYKYREIFSNVSFVMPVGGSFDVIAGKVKRAPVWMQKIGMEWFYRLIQEPRRMWKRYLFTNTEFLILLIKEYIKVQKSSIKN